MPCTSRYRILSVVASDRQVAELAAKSVRRVEPGISYRFEGEQIILTGSKAGSEQVKRLFNQFYTAWSIAKQLSFKTGGQSFIVPQVEVVNV